MTEFPIFIALGKKDRWSPRTELALLDNTFKKPDKSSFSFLFLHFLTFFGYILDPKWQNIFCRWRHSAVKQ